MNASCYICKAFDDGTFINASTEKIFAGTDTRTFAIRLFEIIENNFPVKQGHSVHPLILMLQESDNGIHSLSGIKPIPSEIFMCRMCSRLISDISHHENIYSKLINEFISKYFISNYTTRSKCRTYSNRKKLKPSNLIEFTNCQSQVTMTYNTMNDSPFVANDPSPKNEMLNIKKSDNGTVISCNLLSNFDSNIISSNNELQRKCPFCHKMHSLSKSFLHNCEEYRNELFCEVCQIHFSTFLKLEKHMELIHESQPKLICSFNDCSKTFITPLALKCHEQYHLFSLYQQPKLNKLSDANDEDDVLIIIDENDELDPNLVNEISLELSRSKKFKRLSELPSSSAASENFEIICQDGKKSCDVSKVGKLKLSAMKNGKHSCEICSKTFNSNAHLLEHSVSHSNMKPYNCTFCKEKFKRKNALSRHIKTFHTARKRNISTVETEIEYTCDDCGATYKIKDNYDSHILLHRNIDEDSWPFTCTVCNEKLSSKSTLKHHTLTQHGNAVFNCEYCDMNFKAKMLLNEHISRKHKIGDKEFPCPMCDKFFLLAKDLERHLSSHTMMSQFECKICRKKFRTKETLKKHVTSHSRGEKFSCPLCFIPIETSDDLERHMKNDHSISEVKINKEYPHNCIICGRVFLNNVGLSHHMKSHMEIDDTELVFIEELSPDDDKFFYPIES